MKILSYISALSLMLILSSPSLSGDDGRFANAPKEIQRYEIVDDGGGSVKEFQDALKFIKSTGLGIKIDGYCASACTLVVGANYNLDVCVTPKARLMLHKPFLVRFGPLGYEIVKTIPAIHTSEKIWESDFYRQYPVWLRTEIDKNGGVPSVYTGSQPSEMFVVGFDTLKKFYTVCTTKVKKVS